ncbi:hypothetical protein QYE76_069147 [Lolium multiflorum]|uniref:Transposase (putative) gypsy type domain-containing protein n=1 Tax=Lolium multiflorum TaxID=4521 RepID=A0AAD8SHN4_LOLMU|nr:hypothetical protein QYE76_069147 [Lolium multiflorum]
MSAGAHRGARFSFFAKIAQRRPHSVLGRTSVSAPSSPFAATDRLLAELRRNLRSVEPQDFRRRPQVMYRISGDELEPAPEEGEVVVFAAHFERGFGLPVSDFFRQFLNFYKLQPHHLPGNAVFYLSSYVSFMEAFVGLLPTVDTFARFYNLRINSVQDPADWNPQALESVTPLAAQVGPEWENRVRAQASRVRKAPEPVADASPSVAPPAKRVKKSSLGPFERKCKNKIPTSTGAALELTRSAPGMRPETPADTVRATPPPRQSPVPSGAGKSPSSLRGSNTSSGRAAPKPTNSRTEEEFFSPPDYQDTDASDMGVGSDVVERSEPLVPPVQENKKKTSCFLPRLP